MPQEVVHHLLRSGSVEAVYAGATDRSQRVRRKEDDQLSSLMNHFGSLDRSQRSWHARSCPLANQLAREARVLLRRAPRFFAQARGGQQELLR